MGYSRGNAKNGIRMTRLRKAGAIAVACAIVAGCAQYPALPRAGHDARGTEEMSSDQMAQTDFNRTLTIAMRDNLSSLMSLMTKLYKRNPREWRKSGKPSLAAAAEAVRLSIDARTPPAGLEGLRDIEILAVSLDPAYTGDRVAAFIYGMADTIVTAHDGKTRFYAFDLLDGERVYNAARNVEAAAWLLGSRRDAQGAPLLLANPRGAICAGRGLLSAVDTAGHACDRFAARAPRECGAPAQAGRGRHSPDSDRRIRTGALMAGRACGRLADLSRRIAYASRAEATGKQDTGVARRDSRWRVPAAHDQ